MASPLQSESTTFTLDNMGRFLCNTLQEATDSANEIVAGRRRDFDVIVVGGGTFGSVIAEHLFINDTTHSRRILVLEAGPFVLPEHIQNLPYMGGAPDLRAPWLSHDALKYAGLLFAVGGRSLTWGGWSPELLDMELAQWPASTRSDLRTTYFQQASDQIGVTATNDFIYGRLHVGLRKQLHAGLKQADNAIGLSFADLLDHPAIRYPAPSTPAITPAVLRDWLGLPSTDKTPEHELRELFKLEAPLAVQSTTLPGLFPFNKFSTVPGFTRAARLATTEADGTGPAADARKRVMLVPNCRVQELVTETQLDGWVRVTGVRVWQNGASRVVSLAPPNNGTQSAVVLALGTIETTRVALTTFQHSLAGRAASRMGTNLVAHLRSNLTIRIPLASIAANLPTSTIASLQCAALLVKGKASNGRTYHFQITATGLGKLGTDSEAELFKKLPTLEHLGDMLRATDDTIVITIRGIGDMTPRNPDSYVWLDTQLDELGRPKANVALGNAKASPQLGANSVETNNDRTTWNEMDDAANRIALVFANGQAFDVLVGANRTIRVPAGTDAAGLAALLASFPDRRDALGTTHHDAGTMRMGDVVADSVTNDFGRIHDTTNCYVVGPALFPTIGSPNPMLTGVALAKRTGDLLNAHVLPKPDPFVAQVEPGFTSLFDGTAKTFKNWRLAGPGGGGMAHLDGEMISYGDGGLRLFYYAVEAFANFTLRLQFRIFDLARHNSGVFVRFPQPSLDFATAELDRRARAEPVYSSDNPATKPIITGFEVQIDDTAAGDSTKSFYGIRPEPNGLYKNRTGAIYKIQAGDRIWHLNMNELAVQHYTPGPSLVPGRWFEYEIDVNGDAYAVRLTDLDTGASTVTSTFTNTDTERGRAPGLVGIQVYPNSTLAWRHVRIRRTP